jgi:peptidoglycan hydrolase CwlO-like protein
MKSSRLLLLSIVLTPGFLLADKTQDQLISIQRDVADLSYQVKQIQKTLDDKVTAQSALVQQLLDQMNKMAAAIPAMQREIDQKLTDEQTKLVAPVATLGSKVDGMSSDLGAVRENVAELLRKINDMDQKITDTNSTLRSLQNVTPPPPGPSGATGTTTQVQDNTPPAGMSAEVLWANAVRDHGGGKDDLALD